MTTVDRGKAAALGKQAVEIIRGGHYTAVDGRPYSKTAATYSCATYTPTAN